MLKFWILNIAFSLVSLYFQFVYSQTVEEQAKLCDAKNTNFSDENIEPIIYKYDKQRGECGILGTESHCPDNMEFVLEDGSYGLCKCKGLNSALGDDYSYKLAYHPETDSCYFIFSKGPCPNKQVVAIDERTKKLICEFNPCHNFPPTSFYFNGFCYKERANCNNYGVDKSTMQFTKGYKYPKCMDEYIWNPIKLDLVIDKYQKYCIYDKTLGPLLKFEENFEEHHSPEKMLCRATLTIRKPKFYNYFNKLSSSELILKEECNERNPKNYQDYKIGKYRYDGIRRNCSRVGERSHCPENMIFFDKGHDYIGYGYCDCKHMEYKKENLDYSTIFVYDPPSDQCYKIFSEESCPKNHKVSIDPETGFKKCVYNPCHKKDSFLFGKNCYKIGETCGDFVNERMGFIKNYIYPHCARFFTDFDYDIMETTEGFYNT